jgi:deoxyribonuclease IV
MTITQRRLGVHTSIAGGVDCAVERAKRLGCSTMQIFSHNPRQWSVNKIPEEGASQFRRLRCLYNIDPVFVHTSYLINLCAASQDTFEKSLQLLILEMDLADALNADYVILHTGSASRESEDSARGKAIKALKTTIGQGGWKSRLLLENTAGEKGDISSRIKDLSEIIEGTGTDSIGGVCIDTCHAFAAGYNLLAEDGVSELIREIENYLGIDAVKLIHLNDSKRGYNSKVDRHEHIGKGGIGKAGLKKFVNHPELSSIPLILETPKKSEDDDPRNLRIVRSFFDTTYERI